MSCLPTLPDSGNVIFSPESESGPMLCVAQDGRMTVPSGQVPVPASLSARQAKEKGLLTSGTCGPRSSISSASAGLSQSLASRLRAVTALHGSTLYRLTWKERATPAGRWIPALRASVRRISDNGSTGWPTPTGNSYTGAGSGKREGGLNLQTAVELSGWPTPRARDFHTEGKGKYSPSLSRLAGTLAGWPTPRSVESGHSTGNPARAFNRKSRLEDMVFLAGWATPSARDWKDTLGMATERPDGRNRMDQLPRQAATAEPCRWTASGEMLTGSCAGMESGGQLNPALARWLMGLPPEWDDCAVMVTPSSHRRRKPS